MEPETEPVEPSAGESAGVEAPPKGSVGALLHATRERLGIELFAVAEVLRIREAYLAAIEEGRYELLPGVTYAAGFIRSYAEQLGLDGNELVRRFKLEAGGVVQPPPKSLEFSRPVGAVGVPGTAWFLGLLVIGGMAFGAWHLLSSRDVGLSLLPKLPTALNEKVSRPQLPMLPQAAEEGNGAPVVAAPAPKTETGVAPPPTESAEPAEDAKPAAPAAEPEPAKPEAANPAPAAKPEVVRPEPARPEAAKPTPAAKPEAAKPEAAKTTPAAKVEPAKSVAAKTVPPRAEPAKPAAAAPAAEPAEDIPQTPEAIVPTPRVYGSENAGSRVEIDATAESWVQVTENGSLVLTRLLRPGDRFLAPNRPGLKLMTGNAGGLRVIVDGKPVGALGAVGQVMRDVSLDPDGLGGRKPAE